MITNDRQERFSRRHGNPCRAQHRIAEALGPILGTYVDPCCVEVYPARGAWTHNRMDVQRWTGIVDVNGFKYSIGSWNLTLANMRRGAPMECHDARRDLNPDNNFQFEPDESAR